MKNLTESIIYRWAEDVWNNQQRDAIDTFLDEDILTHGLGSDLPGRDLFKTYYDTFLKEYSNPHMQIILAACEDEIEAALTRFSATHNATGIDVEISGQIMIRIKEEKIVEAWNHYDFLSLYDQLGYKLEKKSE